ncbi:MAG TPA: hypothetical protein VMK42_07315 [Anaeromyxobacteraceae bacterium]|nr:hypothetical protein [Anaeromyxobacteraceae bacterium]
MRAEELHTAHHKAGHFVAYRHIRFSDPDFQAGIVSPSAATGQGQTLPLHGTEFRRRQATAEQSAEVASAPPVFSDLDVEEVKNHVVYLYAGAAAELRFDGSREEEVRATAGRDDEKARELLEDIRRPELEAELRAAAADIVRERWSEVRHLATELLRYKSLGGEEAELVCREAAAAEALAAYRAVHRRRRR